MLNFSRDVPIWCKIRILEKKTTNFPCKFPWNNVLMQYKNLNFTWGLHFSWPYPYFEEKTFWHKKMSPLHVYLVRREVPLLRKDQVQGEWKPMSCSQAHQALIFKPLIPNRKNVFGTHHMKHIFYVNLS
jgi:hypothetical protein